MILVNINICVVSLSFAPYVLNELPVCLVNFVTTDTIIPLYLFLTSTNGNKLYSILFYFHLIINLGVSGPLQVQ